jgi:ABC-type transporter Mla subunit MlaD
MSDSTEELKTAVEGVGEVLTDTATEAEQLTSQATELAEEAAGHGWHGIGTRMQEVAEALESTAGQIAASGSACETAVAELGLINDKIPAAEVVGHIRVSTNQLREAETALQGAVEKADEAQAAAAEVGQEGMMQATLDFCGRLMEVHEQIRLHEAASEAEQTAAEVYAKQQLGNDKG